MVRDEPGRKGAGGGRGRGGKRESQGGGSWRDREKLRKKIVTFPNILQSKWDKEEGTTTERGGKRELKV